ncbi:unnamed protein product [Prorocentrum cordatum]|uniref:Gamma-interferon-inducible lysosomal thiol reductase n=1 Tax=Prorocentrum cordatum TaxID=2364126 RepID=A0ABN9YC86_9DINO|nr:unnamed protein product [Polarella glacialis]
MAARLLSTARALACFAAAAGLTLDAERGAEAPVVDVKLLGEAGCPFTQRLILGALNRTLTSEGVAGALRFDFLPFGNAFFSTKACPNTTYDPATRRCFNRRCGADRVAEGLPLPEDCFQGTLVCQHGRVECEANRWMACARKVAQVPGDERSRASYSGYMPLVHCMTRWYGHAKVGAKSLEHIVAGCAASTGLEWGSLARCYGGPQGDAAIVEAAKGTPVHRVVPWLYVNGEPMEENHEHELFKEVCNALPPSARPQECLKELGEPLERP